ncbi:hypothetical protein SELMODRAFT_182919 [Selaginella moellendorffii]|uniref:Signal peptidase complex subunit 3 n=1 Tax=Selaginella moellendorffii TaxID=88036 RepID=D8SV05_SELML|nr:signal peptidase complex subunit 3B [Selaginella moellendorffii]EFJ11713.1 hypothetical protein SELMODRAFT_182919 [Selaginella moellendorffii]|eukprot:XP_002987137.1 signal peptidase complex subunit 3B [Selaginella moellendorffii]
MHSFLLRGNAVLTFALTVLAVACVLASLTDTLHSSKPEVNVEILSVDAFGRNPGGNDEVVLTLHISADLQSVFTWNTKQLFVFLAAEYESSKNVLNQISIWDSIIQSKEDAKIHRRTRNKYSFVDQGSNLRGKDFNLTLHWNIMPVTGAMFSEKRVLTGFRLPKNYM